MTQKSIQALTLDGCDAKKFFGALQFWGCVGSLLVEYCGWPLWKIRYHLLCGAK